MPDKLFDVFLKTYKEDWEKLAQKETNDFDNLFNKSYEGIITKPIYTAEDLKEKIFPRLELRKKNTKQKWRLIEEVVVNDPIEANRIAIESLQGGADGIQFILKENSVNIEELLNNIWVENCFLSFTFEQNPDAFLQDFIRFCTQKNYNLKKLHGWIDYDPFKCWLITSKLPKGYESHLANSMSVLADISGFGAFTVNSKHFYNSGGNIIHELGFVLSATVEYLELLIGKGFSIHSLFEKVILQLTVGTNFFFEISKLRAIRILLSKIAEGYGLSIQPSTFHIATTSSLWNKSIADMENNTLRNCGELMAAIMGGADFLVATPNRSYPYTVRSRRTLRNISHILKEEAHLDKVVDPAAGSYFLESLTAELTEKSWDLFLQLEKKGGFKESLRSGFVEKLIRETGDLKISNIDWRKDLVIGTNIYPNLEEKIYYQSDEQEGLIKEQRSTDGIERVRTWVELYFTNKLERPKVLISNLFETPLEKGVLVYLKNIFYSVGFVADFQANFKKQREMFNKLHYDLFVCYIDEESLNKENTNFLEEINTKLPLIITSAKKVVIDIGLSDIYLPVEALALHQNLSMILSNLKVAKK